MGRRRSKPPTSSLDLFLDTICNAFGGIMFLSILISVLLQFHGKESSIEIAHPTISEVESEQIMDQLAKLQSERVILVATIASLEKSLVGDDQTEILEMKFRLSTCENQRELAIKQQITLSKQLNNVETEIREQRKELSELEQRIVEARASVDDRSNAVDVAIDSREQKMELPKVRSTSKGNLLMLMRYGKLYLISDVSNVVGRSYYSAHVIETVTLGVTQIKPRPETGWDLTNPTHVSEFERLVSGSSPSRTFFSCAVWPDSFEQFGTLKEMLLRMGYEYHLLPVDDIDDLSIGRGGATLVQ